MKNPSKITHQEEAPKSKGKTIQKLKYTILEITNPVQSVFGFGVFP